MRFVLIALLLLLLVALSLSPISTYDCWTHLAAGKYICQNRSIPAHDPFSWTLHEARWVNHEWLFQVGAYGVHQGMGVTGLILAKTVVIVGTFGLLLVTVYRGDLPVFSTGLVCLAVLSAYPRFVVRPGVVSLLLLAVFLAVLEQVRRSGAHRWLWLLVGLEWVWANTHGYFVVGNVVLTAYLIGELLSRVDVIGRPLGSERMPKRALRTLTWVWLTSFAVTLLTPGLLEGALYPYRTIIASSTGPIRQITELSSPLGSLLTTWCWCFLLLAGLSVVSLVVRGRKVHASDVLLLVVGLLAALKAARNVPYFSLIAVMVAARQWGGGLSSLEDRFGLAERAWFRWGIKPLLAAVVVGLVGWQTWRAATERIYLSDVSARCVGLGAGSDKFSQASLDFLGQHHLDGKIVNNFAIGGFLMFGRFGENQVSVDGRAEVYGPEGMRRQRAMMTGKVPLVDPDNGEDINVVYLGLSSRVDETVKMLLKDSEWKLVYADGAAVIFVRKRAYADLADVELADLARTTLDQLKSPPETGFLARVGFPWEYSQVANLLKLDGRNRLREEVLQAYVARYPHAAIPRFQLGDALLDGQHPYEALEAYIEANRLDPDLPGLAARIGQMYLGLKEHAEALGWLGRAQILSYYRYRDLEHVGDLFAQAGQYDKAAECFHRSWRGTGRVIAGLKCVQALFLAGRVDEANAVLDTLRRQHPNDERLKPTGGVVGAPKKR